MTMTDKAWKLAQDVAKVQERNRIIKLLVQKLKTNPDMTLAEVIELIGGR
jgi:hypothetical protein